MEQRERERESSFSFIFNCRLRTHAIWLHIAVWLLKLFFLRATSIFITIIFVNSRHLSLLVWLCNGFAIFPFHYLDIGNIRWFFSYFSSASNMHRIVFWTLFTSKYYFYCYYYYYLSWDTWTLIYHWLQIEIFACLCHLNITFRRILLQKSQAQQVTSIYIRIFFSTSLQSNCLFTA